MKKIINPAKLTQDLNRLAITAKSVDYSGHPYSATDDLMKIFNTCITGDTWCNLSAEEKNDIHNGFENIRQILNENAEFTKNYPQDFHLTGVQFKVKNQ